MKPLFLALGLAVACPALALRSPIPNPGPVVQQTYWSQDLATAPQGVYVKTYDVSGDGPQVYVFAGGGAYLLTANGGTTPFIASDWEGVLWVKSGGAL